MKNSKLQQYFFVGVFAGVIALAFFVFRPYLEPLALAAICAVLFYPVYAFLLTKVRRADVAAGLSVLCAILLIAVPLSFLGVLLFNEAQNAGEHLHAGTAGGASAMLLPLETRINAYLPPELHVSVKDTFVSGVSWVTSNMGSVFAGTANFLLALFIAIVAFFYFLRDGSVFTALFLKLSPLDDSYDRQILKKLKNTINSVVRGSLFIAFLQGALAGIALAVVGIPNAVLWGAVAGIGALIPNVGTAIVLAPAVVYLFATGAVIESVGLTLWGFLVIGLIDNVLLPRLIGGGAQIHPLLLLFGVLGGLAFFGPSGLIFGPLAIALLYVLVDIYFVVLEQEKESSST